jgi:hypothetical protein
MTFFDRTARTVTLTQAQMRFTDWTADVLVYIVVLNLFVEYVDEVIIDSFTISILTAVLLKLMLDLILGLEHRVRHWFAQKEGTAWRVLGAVTVFTILFTSKLLILEVVNIVFGDHVELGHFVEVIALIVSMIVARKLVNWTFQRLGVTADEEPEEAATA